MLKEIKLYGTTDGSGDLTVDADISVFGKLFAVQWIDGTFADGVDAVLSTQGHAASGTLLTLTNANDDALHYPRHALQDNAGADITDWYEQPLVAGKLRLVVSSGGDTKEGGCLVYVED